MMIEICEHCAERLREKLAIHHPDIESTEIERLKLSLELYRKDIRVMRERENTKTIERMALRDEIARLKSDYDSLSKAHAALLNPDIDVAGERARAAWLKARTGEEWREVARAVFGLDNA
jgi:hypothetical protein